MPGDTKMWEQLVVKVGAAAKRKIRVGILEDGETATIGLHHEYGAPRANIPERSWLRSTFNERGNDLAKVQARVVRAILAGKLTVQQGLELLGAWAMNAVKRQITTSGTFEPLKPRTIARKGSSKPLIDTAQMLNAIRFVILG